MTDLIWLPSEGVADCLLAQLKLPINATRKRDENRFSVTESAILGQARHQRKQIAKVQSLDTMLRRP